jgi:hypothetical protein
MPYAPTSGLLLEIYFAPSAASVVNPLIFYCYCAIKILG